LEVLYFEQQKEKDQYSKESSMAGTSLIALIDDIASILDDISVLTKVAAKKTAGVLGDDLALNAEQVSGVRADRELPVVWAVAKGSFKNKLILVPGALAISAFIPWLITPLLMIGGGYLCYEGFEKLAHVFLHSKKEDKTDHDEVIKALSDPDMDMVALEKKKIQGAIRTDFVLSAEIIVISLGTVKDAPFASQATVVSIIAFVMTVGVYGLVAGIVKLDDGGLALIKSTAKNSWGSFKRSLGWGILVFAPYLMKTLSVVGTAAMFLVGGGILLHGIPDSHSYVHHAVLAVKSIPKVGGLFAMLTPMLTNAAVGIIAGAFLLAIGSLAQRLRGKPQPQA
jgi:predicted DNA repair protein MutK